MKKLLLVFLVVGLASPAVANASVQIISPPSSLATTESDTDVFLFKEHAVAIGGAGLLVDWTGDGTVTLVPATVAYNTTVDSYTLFANSVSDGSPNIKYYASVVFSGPILGLFVQNAGQLDESDGTFGEPGVTYAGQMNFPSDILVQNGGTKLSFDPTVVAAGIDRVRIIVGEGTKIIPEPSTLIIWSLLGGLGMTLGWWRRRRNAA